jgi:hypothetical protein
MSKSKQHTIGDKLKVIDRLLVNPSYAKASGLRESLAQALVSLPYYQLQNLELIISLGRGKAKGQ